MQMRITQNDMRKELAKNALRMHEMRGEALAGGKVTADMRLAFRREVACAMSYVEAIEDASIAGPRLDRLLACTTDPAFAKYDSTQDRWWLTNDGGKEFLSNLRLLTLHYMHAGAQGMEDAFFMFQVMKCRFEKDQQTRVDDDFLQPAYGGIWLPSDKDYTGALMRHLSNDMTVKVIGNDCRLVLRLDWWPDEGEAGVKQLARVVESAAQMGYAKVEFIKPAEYRYDELNKEYGSSISTRQDERNGKPVWIGSIAAAMPEAAKSGDSPLVGIEVGEVPVRSLIGKGGEGNIIENDWEGDFAIAAGREAFGFVDRMLLSLESERALVNVGIFFKKLNLPMEAEGAFNFAVLKARQAMRIGELDVERWEKEIMGIARAFSHTFCYAVLRNKNTGEETNLEHAADEPKWNDI